MKKEKLSDLINPSVLMEKFGAVIDQELNKHNRVASMINNKDTLIEEAVKNMKTDDLTTAHVPKMLKEEMNQEEYKALISNAIVLKPEEIMQGSMSKPSVSNAAAFKQPQNISLNELLTKLHPVDFRDVLSLDVENLKRHHYLVGVHKMVLKKANEYHCSLCKHEECIYNYREGYCRLLFCLAQCCPLSVSPEGGKVCAALLLQFF